MAALARPPDHYHRVAEVYLAAQQASNPAPGRAVARTFGVSDATASQWTRHARSLGLIPTPPPHRPHGGGPYPVKSMLPPPEILLETPLETPLVTPDDVRITPAARDEAFGDPRGLVDDLGALRRLATRVARVVDAETSADRLATGARLLAALTGQIRSAERAVRLQIEAAEAREMAKLAAEKAEKERLDALNDEFAALAAGNWVDS